VADGARDRMVSSASRLLATRGYQGTSFSSILEDSGAPRGSIYHHFPGGKDDVVLEALDLFRDRATALVDRMRGLEPAAVVAAFVDGWRRILEVSEFRSGCAVVGATVSAGDAAVVEHAGAVFRTWEEHLERLLVDAGVRPEEAGDLSTTLMAACEGAVVICRAQRSFAPLDAVERQLLRLVTS
jgi:TetR/AcrR family transcriptional regulator, lmrAB and yxaGH operons repressor